MNDIGMLRRDSINDFEYYNEFVNRIGGLFRILQRSYI